MKDSLKAVRPLILALGGAFLLVACDTDLGGDAGPEPTAGSAKKRRDPVYSQSVFGEGGLSFGSDDIGGTAEPTTGVGVNTFLWRASLDTLSFMPLSSADPFGGVIITDWYSPPDTPDERFKMTAYILDRSLRSDGIRVAVFRQIRGVAGDWIDAQVNPRTGSDIEDRILERARQLRIAAVGE
ncbi:MAG: DUF3576 domain-containing protein [Alphaproteobacteria bacterium]